MTRLQSTWYTHRLAQDVTVIRNGHFGVPVLLFPTAGGDAGECERFHLIAAAEPLLAAGRVKIYSVDSVAGRCWTDGHSSGGHRAYIQNQFDAFIYRELVPAIRQDCGDPHIGIITAGASIGAFNALAAICRHPNVFTRAVCMSGTYDLTRWTNGEHTLDLHYSSPLHFLPYLDDGPQLALLRQRFIVLATGEGMWEAPGESWHVGHALGKKGVPNRVDLWGPHYDHNWSTWREMLPVYLDQLVD